MRKSKREFPVSGTPFLLLVFNCLNPCKRVSAVPFFVSKKEIVKVTAEIKLAVTHDVLLYCCGANVGAEFK